MFSQLSTRKIITLFKSGFEACGLWLLIVLAGALLMAGLVAQQQDQQKIAIQEQAWILSLQGLQSTIGLEVSMGVDISDSPRIENLLTQVQQRHPDLQSVNVIDGRGMVLYSTNRAALQQSLPLAVLQAAHSAAAAGHWQRQWGDWWFMGLPLHNAHTENIGHVLLSKARQSASPSTTGGLDLGLASALFQALAICITVGMCVVLWVGWSVQQRRKLLAPMMQDAMRSIEEAAQHIQQGFHDLDRLEQQA